MRRSDQFDVRKPCRYFLSCTLIAFLFVAITVTPALSKDIVLGMSAAFSGANKDLGHKLYAGSMCYIDYINKHGGIAGNKIKLLTLDDGYNPEPTIANTIQFVEQDDVFCLFDYVGTPTVTRMLPLLTKYQSRPLFLLFPFTGANPQRELPYRNRVLNFRASYDTEIQAIINAFIHKGYSKFAIFYQADAYGRSGWQSVKYALNKHRIKLVGQASYKRGSRFQDSFRVQAVLLKKHTPDVIICVAASEAAAGFIRDARDNGLNIPIANISFVDPGTLISLLGKLKRTKGHDYSRNLINSQVVPFFDDPALPAGREFLKLIHLFHKKHKKSVPANGGSEPCEHPGPICFEGFLNAKVLVELLKNLGPSPKAANIPQAFAKLDGVNIGIKFPLRVDIAMSQIKNQIYFVTFQNGTLVPADPTTIQDIAQ